MLTRVLLSQHLKSHKIVFVLPMNLHTCSCCCCLPTHMTLANGGSPISPLVVHQPASPSIWPPVHSLRLGLSVNPGVTMWCVCGRSWRDDVCRVCVLQRGNSGDGCVLSSTLCKYTLRKGDLFVMSWQGCDKWGGEVSLQSL